jgi:hypothetical protein
MHFGATPSAQTHAATEAAQAALTRLGLPRAVAPQRALLETVWEAAGNVAFLREQAGALGLDLTLKAAEVAVRPSSGEVTADGETQDFSGHVVTIREDARAVIKLYGEWCDRLAKYAKAAVDAGIAEREIRIAEGEAAQIVRVIEATLSGLNLTPEQRAQGRQIATGELRLIAASPASLSRN